MGDAIAEQRASLAAFKIDPPLTQSEAHAAQSLAFIFGGLVPEGTPDRVVAAATLMLMASAFSLPDIIQQAADSIGAPVNA